VQEYPGPPTGESVPAIPLPPTAIAETSWRSLGGLATALTWLLAADALAAIFVIFSLAKRLGVVSDFKRDGFSLDLLDRAQSSDDLVSAASLVFLVLFIGTAACFITWMWRAAKNNEALGRQNPRFGPGWAIGGWFIPIANFVIPLLIMQDLWRGSDVTSERGSIGWRRAKGSGLVGWWWAALLLHVIRLGGGGNADERNPDLSEIQSSNRVALAGFCFAVPAAVLAIFVVRRLSARQEACLRDQQEKWRAAYGTPPIA
jgi:ABC-type Fe3+ transport system permease subunit